ncbi:aminotransferase class I/II-fold pyridoxal phosphate-dependent enzyme [Sporosarcina sp. YIM B06819]|uniref:aminotransferase class I/II-fold pyridoxal phosphate-dependent enzyme n=1 Tax=Sporosarcina sp. YIM B06819 TaxID=3081769 RepID=UPI00298C86CE|nr:aminotransferase class I/II-fold pyridoxal phosphate-dependent enzyme [Sporosarcina sp. YIM B06819]
MESLKRPLVEALLKFNEADPISFHVPGHKGGILSGLPAVLRSALRYDFTELTGLDDLHEPGGIIEEAQERLSSFYGSDQSFFLVNGSTVGNLAMIYATCCAGDTIIVQRNAHKSVFHAIELVDAKPVLVSPAWDEVTKTAGTMTITQISEVLEAYPDAKAVVITHPTYYGTTGNDLEETIRLCHTYGVPVLVDEAHGAHFVVGDPFPRSALEMGADVVVHSAHKTLPAMTMASFLHVRSNLVSSERVAHYLQMLQSSSPSYVLMASLDDARAFAESYQEEDKILFMQRRTDFMKRLATISGLQTLEVDDPLKLLIRVEGYSGFELQRELETEGVYAELADPYQVLFVLPLLKRGLNYAFEEIGRKIESAIIRLNQADRTANPIEVPLLGEGVSYLTYTARQLRDIATEWIPYEIAVGRVAAATIIPYPPGIPLLIGGEEVGDGHIQSLKKLLQMGAKFQGAIRINEGQIVVVKEGTEE